MQTVCSGIADMLLHMNKDEALGNNVLVAITLLFTQQIKLIDQQKEEINYYKPCAEWGQWAKYAWESKERQQR